MCVEEGKHLAGESELKTKTLVFGNKTINAVTCDYLSVL